MKENSRGSYWLLSDDRLEISKNTSKYELFKAYLKHSMLFNESIIISDSNIINNLNLRRAIRYDEDIQMLASDQILKIAIRTNGSNSSNLCDIRDTMIGNIQPREFKHKDYISSGELSLLDASAQFLPYSIKGVSESYSRNVLNLFKGELGQKNIRDMNLHSLIVELIETEIDLNGKVGRAFFYYDIPKVIKKKKWSLYGGSIKDLANAPYLSTLPSVLNANPVYSKEHKKAFEIMRGTKLSKQEGNYKSKFSSKLGLQSFVKGMGLLTRDSILNILDTEESANYFIASNKLTISDSDILELQQAIQCYQLVIEDEIIRNHRWLKGESLDGSDREIRQTFSEYMNSGGDSITYLSTFFSVFEGISPLSLLFTSPARQLIKSTFNIAEDDPTSVIKRVMSNREFHRDELLAEFLEEKSERISSEDIFIPLPESQYE